MLLSWLERTLLDPAGLTPHGFCLLWEPWLIWLHALSDVGIGLAYFTIPLALAVFARRRRDLVFRPVFWLFAAFILLCGAGHWLDLLTIWVPAYGLEGMVKGATAVVSIVTAAALWPLLPKALALPSPAQLRDVNDALRRSEAYARTSYTLTPLPLHTLDAAGTITAVSDRWLDLLGYRMEEVLGRSILDFQEPASAADTRADWDRLMAKGEVLDAPRRFLRRDGAVLDVLASGRLERTPDGAIRVLGALVDVTARLRAEAALRRSEAQLSQAQKMEAIGQLTGGVAHDFNNVLQAVTGNLELIRRRLLPGQDDLRRMAGHALEASARAARLTAQLLSFARRQRLVPMPLDPVEVVAEMRALLARSIGARIELRLDADPTLGPCLADRSQLEAAVLNLVVNARDAIEMGDTGGRITIALSAEHVARAPEGWPPDGDYVRISVRDDGPGMPEEVRARACEPFFTTKPLGKGSGLGLAQIHGFAHQSGGTVRIDSAPGRGTEVAILLPAARQPSAGPAAAPEPAPVPMGAGQAVLLVDDDPLVRQVLAGMLAELGYRALEAADGDSAFALLQDGARVDVVLTDLSMPGGLDGIGLADAIQARWPGLPVLLATGLMDPFESRRLRPEAVVIQKPYGRAELAGALRDALRAGAAQHVR